jgi:acetoin utilization deacetylase AcuC-like enzyme
VDTFADDPISKFQLREPEYLKLGAQIEALNLPTVFILEGGYAVAEIGHNVAHVLRGFEDAAK